MQKRKQQIERSKPKMRDLKMLQGLLGAEVMLDGGRLCPCRGGLERLALIIHAHLEAMHLCLCARAI